MYSDPKVDIVYIGTPHAFHRQNCLDAIKHGKHVLCEKAFALNAAETREIFAAAREKGVVVMEAMWTRFFPLTTRLQAMPHSEKVIGDVSRVFCDFAMKQEIDSRPADSGLKNPALGAGSLLDIGIYSLTWGIIGLETNEKEGGANPKVIASQHLIGGVDRSSTIILMYPGGEQGILTSSTTVKTAPEFCRIEGSKGTVIIKGVAASAPSSFTVMLPGQEPREYEFGRAGKGFYWEADAERWILRPGDRKTLRCRGRRRFVFWRYLMRCGDKAGRHSHRRTVEEWSVFSLNRARGSPFNNIPSPLLPG